MHYQVNAIFAVHSSRGLVFGSTAWVDFEEICFEVDAELSSTEVVEWRMELTGLPDTVMGTLKAERRRSTEEGARPSRSDLPIYVARILTMSDRDRELYRSWLEDRSESRSPKDPSIKSLLSRSKGPRSVAPEPKVARAPEPKADPQADPKTHGTESTSERYGLHDRSSRQRSSLGRQAIRDALRASLRGGPASKDEQPPRKANDWLDNAGRGRSPSFLDERPAARRNKPDDDATKPPEYDFPALDQANDTAHAMGFRERAKSREPAAPSPPEPAPERTPTPTIPSVTPPAEVEVARDLHVVRRAPAMTTRATRPAPPAEPPHDTTPSLDEFIRAPLPAPPAPKPEVRPDAGATPDLPGRTVTVLPRSRPPQVTVHYREQALFQADYEKHLRGGGIVIQLPDLDTTGMRAFIRLVLPSGKDVRCRAEVVTLLPEGAGVQLQLRPEDKELLRSEAER